MKAHELWKENPVLKVGIYGASGTGKTAWSCMSPRPLVLLTEPQGLATIQVWNPEAIVKVVSDYKDFWKLYKDIRLGSLVMVDGQPAFSCKLNGEEVTFQTLVLDSFTDIQEKMVDHYTMDRDKKGKPKDNTTVEEWGKILKASKKLLMDLRDLPVSVISLFLVQAKQAGEGGPISTLPALYGKSFPYSIGQYFNAFGFSFKRKGDKFYINWSLGQDYLTKKPPTRQKFPDVTSHNATLGSMMLFLYPGLSIAHVEGQDSAEILANN